MAFLHCWGCSRRFWSEQVSYFTDSHTVIALDFRGHGESDMPDSGYTLGRLAADVHEVLLGLDLAPAIVVGHSMGGMVAQQLAIDYHEDVRALVLVATTSADPDNTLISAKIADETPRLGYVNALTKTFPLWFLPDADESIVRWTRDEMQRVPENVTLELVSDYLGLDFRPELPGIQATTLVIAARGDASTPVAGSKVIANLISDSELVVIEGVGHFVQLERPAEVNAAIRRFLSAQGF